jgi:MFS family permease
MKLAVPDVLSLIVADTGIVNTVWYELYGAPVCLGVLPSAIVHFKDAFSRLWGICQQLHLIGSIQAFFLMVVAPAVGRMCDTGCARHVVRIGTALISSELVICSFFGNTYVATLFLQGVLTGIGLGYLFTPAMAVLPPYFVRLRHGKRPASRPTCPSVRRATGQAVRRSEGWS